MFIIKKNQVIITALVAMVAVAGYLNYIDSTPSEPSQVVLEDQGNILNAKLEDVEPVAQNDNEDVQLADNAEQVAENPEIDDEIAIAQAETEQVADIDPNTAGEAVFVNTSQDSSYFLQAKLEREQARSKQQNILTEMINNENITNEQKAECADKMLEIQQRIEKETASEAMIESKGFEEVYVRVDDDTVDVVVDKDTLSEAEIAQIQDIIKRKIGVSADKIRISPLKKK